MHDYVLFMHNDVPDGQPRPDQEWSAYFAKLRESGAFQGGSSIGGGVCVTKSTSSRPITSSLSGYIRVCARDLSAARELVIGNPVYEAGGTVEVRELPKD